MAKTYTNKQSQLPCPNSSASFWHSEPNPFLLSHRTTPTLPSKTDIVIIGTGITGASIARYLTSDPRTKSLNLSILVLEAREVCWGATGRNGGHCQPLLFDRSPDVASFEVKNVEAVRSYIEEHGVECEWRSVTGCRSFWTDELFEAAKRDIEALGEVDTKLRSRVSLIEPGDTEKLREHRVAPDARGVTLTEGAGQLWPYKYVTFIFEKLVKEGRLNLQTHTPVTKLETNNDDKSHPVTIHTPRGTVKARHTILATNGYTSALLPQYTDLLVPVRCEMSALHPPKNSTRLPNSYGMVGHNEGNPAHDDYLIQRPFYDSPNNDGSQRGGHLMFGGGRTFAMYDCVGESEDDIVDPGEARYLREALLKALQLDGEVEGLKELRASHQWTGIKGYSRDNVPWVGKVPVSTEADGDIPFHAGLWMCGGYTGHGMPNATLCGRAVVEMVLAEEEGKVSHEGVCERLVDGGDLPRSYLISEERVKKACGMPSVLEQEEMGMNEGIARVGMVGLGGGVEGKGGENAETERKGSSWFGWVRG